MAGRAPFASAPRRRPQGTRPIDRPAAVGSVHAGGGRVCGGGRQGGMNSQTGRWRTRRASHSTRSTTAAAKKKRATTTPPARRARATADVRGGWPCAPRGGAVQGRMAIDDAHLPPPPLTVPSACRPPPRHAARSHSPPTPTGSVAHTTTRVVRVGDACDRPARTRWRRRRRWECDCARRTAGTLPPPPPPPPPARHVSRRCARGGQRGGGATRVLRTNAPGTSTPAGAPPPAARGGI